MLIIELIKLPLKLYRLHYNKRKYKSFGNNSVIIKPLKIHGHKNISIGDNVRIGYKSWLASMPLTDSDVCQLIIEDGTMIGDFNHIYSTGSVIFERNSLTANFVYISDNLHCFEDINTAIVDQPIKQLKPVVIGEGCWIGEHVSIIGASVGKHSVVGANSTVTRDIPDYCVAVGSPAYIIKRYNFESQKWEKTDKEGNFLIR